MLEGEELIRPNRFFATHGKWSGQAGRYHKRYIAIIPVSRYNDPKPRDLSGLSQLAKAQARVKSINKVYNARFRKEAHNYTEVDDQPPT
jgi:ABC-type Zn uptake system ZnuABC Zn-binding protein ZnuA